LIQKIAKRSISFVIDVLQELVMSIAWQVGF